MRKRGDSARASDMLHAFGETRLMTIYIGLRRLVQIPVERFLDGANVTLFDHDLGEMRASRHTPSSSGGFFERNLDPELLETGGQAPIPISTGRLHVQHPLPDFFDLNT